MKSHAVPRIERQVLVDGGTHFTVRRQMKSSRKIVHHPISEFEVDAFDARYLPVRASSNYRGRKNKIGHLWMSKTRRLVAYESTLERTVLLDLDRDQSVKRLWSQPFRVEGIDPERRGRCVRPTPDLLVERTDGSLCVVEVKPQRRLTEPALDWFGGDVAAYTKSCERWSRLHEGFAFQQTVFDSLGWEFAVRSELSQERRANLEYLALYRRDLHERDSLAEQVMEAASYGPARIVDLAESVDGGFVSAMPVILHLVWRHLLEVDLDVKLSADTTVYDPAASAESSPLLAVA